MGQWDDITGGICECGKRLNGTDKFCPECGRKLKWKEKGNDRNFKENAKQLR